MYNIYSVSFVDLYHGFYQKEIPLIDGTFGMFAVLGSCTVAKGVLYFYCIYINHSLKSDTVAALSEDHFNDVISNSMAIATAAIAGTKNSIYRYMLYI